MRNSLALPVTAGALLALALHQPLGLLSVQAEGSAPGLVVPRSRLLEALWRAGSAKGLE